MPAAMKDFAPHIAAMLTGGLVASLGVSWASRRPRGRALLLATPGWALALGALLATGAGGGAIYWLVRRFLDAALGEPTMPAPGALLVFGLALGLPLSLPAVVMAWSDARAQRAAQSKKRDWVPTKDDRREYAEKLARQIADLSQRPRDVRAAVGGDGGRVLVLEGDLDAEEAGRLVKALRGDLKEVGFKRVESGGNKPAWWERV